MTSPPDGPPAAPAQLAGFSVVLTSDRRAEEFGASFVRRGATVLHAPILRIVPIGEDERLREATLQVIAEPPDDVVVTTAIGFRGWVEAADALGLADDLLAALAGSRLLARGPKARGAIRAAGLVEEWAATSETTAEVIDRLLERGCRGDRVVVQQHGLPDAAAVERLVQAGARVQEIPVYRWGPSPDPAAVTRALDMVCGHSVDAVVFTSAPGSQAFLDAARQAGRSHDLLAALRADVVAAAVGPVTAGPLRAAGLDPLVPDRYRLGALVRAVAEHLSSTRVRTVRTEGGELSLRGQAAWLDGCPLTLSPAPMAMLRILARAPGNVVDRETLRTVLPGAGDLHAVEVAVARLRAGLGRDGVVRTVVKRGYRLAVVEPGTEEHATTAATGPRTDVHG
jgi:uroporphyrinogen-III synthase